VKQKAAELTPENVARGMGGFFNGWRRKVGLVILLMACVFAAVWVRSKRIEDEFSFPVGPHSTVQLISARSFAMIVRINIETTDSTQTVPLFLSRTPTVWFRSQPHNDDPTVFYEHISLEHGIDPHRSWTADIHWIIETSNVSCQSIHLPCWIIVIPLTVIALCLLLSKPRQLNQMKISEPI
jgi:hypothetical protein